ncbi:MAG: ABC transporter ATP-binding protein [Hyphomicrobiales bacterium]
MSFELQSVGFSFDGKTVIDAVSLSLASGRFYGVVGPNGCGKTTLVDLLCRFRMPQHGQIFYDGRPLSVYSKRRLALEISLVPQNFYINFPFRVWDVVMMGRYPYIPRFGRPSARDMGVVAAAMEAADIAAMSERLITELSGGERQRVVFARALAQDTPVLILDEATSNLDVGHAIRLLGLAAGRVRQQSKTVLAVFQDINQAAAYCDHVIFMSRGRIAAHGDTREVLTPDTLRSVFDVDAKVYHDDYSNSLQVVFKK